MTDAAPEVEKRRRRPTLPRPRPGRVGPRLQVPGARRLRDTRLVALLGRRPPAWTGRRILATAFLLLVLIVALAAPGVVSLLGVKAPQLRDPSALNLFGNPTGPSAAHPLGVDSEGRDVLSRMLYGLRSLVLLSLAGVAPAVLVGCLLAQTRLLSGRIGRLARQVRDLLTWPLEALASFPPLLLGLALGLSVGPGVWRLVLVLMLTQLGGALALTEVHIPAAGGDTLAAGGGIPAAGGDRAPRHRIGLLSARRLTRALLALLPGAVVIDFGLTFLGDGPGGKAPQLGAMVARAGEGILAGVPAWWALVFPGLLVMLMLAAAASAMPSPHLPRAGAQVISGTRPRYVLGRLGAAGIQAVLVLALAALMFTSLAGSDGAGHGALSPFGPELSATVSLLAGAVAVWLVATLAQVWIATGRHRRVGRWSVSWVRAPALLGTAAPTGWLAFLTLYLFSDSVGKLPILPGAGSYVGLTHDPGRWVQSLLIPWLLLGLGQTARMTPALARRITQEAGSAQQRVARAAGVTEAVLSRQRRRALVAPLLEVARHQMVTLISLVTVIEASFRIGGVGALAVSGFGHGRAATVSDVATLAALLVVVSGLIIDWLRVLVDPRVAST